MPLSGDNNPDEMGILAVDFVSYKDHCNGVLPKSIVKDGSSVRTMCQTYYWVPKEGSPGTVHLLCQISLGTSANERQVPPSLKAMESASTLHSAPLQH